MLRRKSKFKLSLGKISIENLTVEIENDQASDPEFMDNLRASLGSVIEAPARLLSIGMNGDGGASSQIAASIDQPDANSSSSKQRRRRKTSPPGKPRAVTRVGNDPGDQASGAGTPGVRPASVKGLIIKLHQENYFQEERSSADVSQELSNRWGRNVKTNHIATLLQQLTGDILSRRRAEDRRMFYRSADHVI